jgi:hypothetical protein
MSSRTAAQFREALAHPKNRSHAEFKWFPNKIAKTARQNVDTKCSKFRIFAE